MSATVKKSKAPAKAPPQLFHNHRQMALRNITVAVCFALFAAFTFNLVHNKPRKAKYREFYSNYDPDKSFRRMAEGGYLQSCPPCIFEEEQNQNGDGDKKKKK